MIFNALSFYMSLCLVSVTLHTSKPYPTLKNPKNYDIGGCSGVFIGSNEVLTAAHCLKNARRQWIKTSDGKSHKAVIKKIDPWKDLAIVTIPSIKQHEFVKLGKPVQITDKVYTVNSGEGYQQTYNEGVVNNLFDDEITQVLTLLHSATIFPGASGSGLFNMRGELVGINVSTVHSLSGAVDLTVIKEFLRVRT